MPEFTASQREAIQFRGQDACVVAGPGSGKTTVLVERYRALILEHGFEPRNILAITFTEKAAANLKAKLLELFEHEPARQRDLESAYVSTIHGFCTRILRDHAVAAGIDPRFSVLDAREAEELQYACLSAALDELVEQRRAEALELIAALQKPDLAGELMNVYDAIRSAGMTIAEVRAMPNPAVSPTPREVAARLREIVGTWPTRGLTAARLTQRGELLEWAQRLDEADVSDLKSFARLIAECPKNQTRVPEIKIFKEGLPQLLAWAVDRHTAHFRALIFEVLARFDELYSERKRTAARIDFNDLERRTVELLRASEAVRNAIRAQFRQVMLDEFQDINEQQDQLIRLIRDEDVFFAVGDMNQSIYGFRHARPEIFHRYHAEVLSSGKQATKLLHNFRSRPEILKCVEALLNPAEGIHARELVAGSVFGQKAEPSIEVLKVLDKDKDQAAEKEAAWIAHRILSLRRTLRIGENGNTRRPDFRDFAVLCRNSDSMTQILEACDKADIPYVCGRRQSFLLSREGLDIRALLHTIANPQDSIALATVLRSGLVGIGDESLLRIRLLAKTLPSGLNRIAHDNSLLAEFAPEDSAKLAQFTANLKRWRTAQPVTPLEPLIVRALSDCGLEWIPGTAAADRIESFLRLARTRGERQSLMEFLREIESISKTPDGESVLADADQGDCVQVMTAHSAKGLEFPIAIIAAMDKGTQRGSAPVTFTPEVGLGVRWRDPAGKEKDGLKDSWQMRNAESLKERERHEANRLLYVAMTRAAEHLIVSYSEKKGAGSNWAKNIDDFFGLKERKPADNPQIDATTGFDVSILVTESGPALAAHEEIDAASEEEVLRVPRPAVGDRHDSAVNVTSLAVFADCPRKYYLQRYIGWNGQLPRPLDPEDLLVRGDDSAELNAADLGSAVHEILAGRAGSYPEEAHRLARTFLDSELSRRASAASRSEREWAFIVEIGGTLVSGTVDLWFEEEGEVVIVDYKTDAQQRPEAYFPQLALYALAMERAFGKRPTEVWLYFLRFGSPVNIPVDDAAMDRVKGLLAELANAQDELRFDLHEGEHCRRCAFYRSLCPAGSQTMTAPASAMAY